MFGPVGGGWLVHRGRVALVGLAALALLGVSVELLGEDVPWTGARAILASPETFREWIDSFGPWAPAAFVLAEAVQVIAAPIPGSIFPAVGAAAFGPEAALALSLGGMLAGAAVVFALARRWGRPLALRLVGRDAFDRYVGIVGSRGGLWLFLALLVPVLPGDAICALGGLSSLSFRRFMLVTALGRLPGTALTAFLASDLLGRPPWVWLVSAGVLLAVLAVALHEQPRLESWLLGSADKRTGPPRSACRPRRTSERSTRRAADQTAEAVLRSAVHFGLIDARRPARRAPGGWRRSRSASPACGCWSVWLP